MGRLRLRATPVGDAVLIHPRERIDARAAGFAGGLARDPQHTLVVVDLPAGALAEEWPAVARVLSSSRYGGLRMVFGRDTGEDVRRAAGKIADRLGREVVAPDGAVLPTAGGGLFVPGDDAAWLRFRPGLAAETDSHRFPTPDWEFSLPGRARAVGRHTTAQPVASGVWLRHTDRGRLAEHHRRAVVTVPTDPRRLLVVLGSPDAPPLPLDDVARYWESVLPDARSAVRFHLYGTLDIPESLAPGQCLADALDHEVILCAELPSGAPGRAADEESPAYVPAGGGASPLGPDEAAGDTRMPPAGEAPYAPDGQPDTLPGEGGIGAGTAPAGVAGGEEITAAAVSPPPAAGAAVPAAEPPPAEQALPRVQTESGRATTQAAAAREIPAPQAPGTESGSGLAPDLTPPLLEAVTAAAGSPEPQAAGRHPAAASEAGPRPAPPQRTVRPAAPRFRLESGIPAAESEAVREPQAGPHPSPAAVPSPDPVAARPAEAGGVTVQPVPDTAACAIPPERGIARERDWMRRTFSDQYNAIAGSVQRVMSESPGLRGGSRTEAAEALTELVAVRLYLSGDSRRVDAAVRTAAAGPHVPLARLVTAGLRRLPSYRGPALLRTRLTDAERSWYREGRPVTEWGFCHARTSLHTGPRGKGATDILIWSMTARRTGSLDPDPADRVLFLPGTTFKVLRTEGSTVLMRELSPSETRGDGGRPTSYDEIALKGLGNILDALEKAATDATAQSADPPGLVLDPDPGRTGGTEGAKP
nr:hypothetical protein OH826_18425 [Streptomyces sp. NBC_00899]